MYCHALIKKYYGFLIVRCNVGRALDEEVVVPWKKLQKLLSRRELAQKKKLNQLRDGEAIP